MSSYVLDTPTVLIADDDEATRILLRSALLQWGYPVVEARDGEEAWQFLKQPHPPEILTLDWIMPKLDGISLCKRINRELSFHPYIIFLTRMTGAENVMQGLDAGADEFIIKPIDLPELRIRMFAGERIIRYRRQLAELELQLNEYASRMKAFEDLCVVTKRAIPYLHDVMQEIGGMLSSVKVILQTDNTENFNKFAEIEALQQKIKNALELIGQLNMTTDIPAKTIQAPAPIHNHVTLEPINKVSAPVEQTAGVIDLARMKAFFGDDMSQIKDFIQTFIGISLQQAVDLQNAIKLHDPKLVKYYFHLMGSASGNSGIAKMYDVCGRGEEKATRMDWVGVNLCFEELTHVIAELQEEMDKNFQF